MFSYWDSNTAKNDQVEYCKTGSISVDWSIKLIHHSKRQPEPINSYPTLKIRL